MPRRRGVWIPHLFATTVAAGGTLRQNLLTNLPLDIEALGGLTVERIVGEVKYNCAVVGVTQLFSAGVTVRHEDLPAANLGTELAGETGDWMWQLHTRTSGIFQEVAAGDFDPIDEMRPVDIRVARKMKANDELSMVWKNDAGQALAILTGVRTYVLLP